MKPIIIVSTEHRHPWPPCRRKFSFIAMVKLAALHVRFPTRWQEHVHDGKRITLPVTEAINCWTWRCQSTTCNTYMARASGWWGCTFCGKVEHCHHDRASHYRTVTSHQPPSRNNPLTKTHEEILSCSSMKSTSGF